MLLFLHFYRWRTWVSENLNYLSKVTQPLGFKSMSEWWHGLVIRNYTILYLNYRVFISQLLSISETILVVRYNSLKIKLEFWQEIEKWFSYLLSASDTSEVIETVQVKHDSSESGWLITPAEALFHIQQPITPIKPRDAARGLGNPIAHANTISVTTLVLTSPII